MINVLVMGGYRLLVFGDLLNIKILWHFENFLTEDHWGTLCECKDYLFYYKDCESKDYLCYFKHCECKHCFCLFKDYGNAKTTYFTSKPVWMQNTAFFASKHVYIQVYIFYFKEWMQRLLTLLKGPCEYKDYWYYFRDCANAKTTYVTPKTVRIQKTWTYSPLFYKVPPTRWYVVM